MWLEMKLWKSQFRFPCKYSSRTLVFLLLLKFLYWDLPSMVRKGSRPCSWPVSSFSFCKIWSTFPLQTFYKMFWNFYYRVWTALLSDYLVKNTERIWVRPLSFSMNYYKLLLFYYYYLVLLLFYCYIYRSSNLLQL